MEKLLILDDDKRRHQQFSQKYLKVTHNNGDEVDNELVHVYTSHDCIKLLENHDFDYVFLDHDLGGKIMEESGPGTGYEVAEWLSNNPHRAPKKCIIVHSLNPVGSKNMVDVLSKVETEVMAVPYIWANKA